MIVNFAQAFLRFFFFQICFQPTNHVRYFRQNILSWTKEFGKGIYYILFNKIIRCKFKKAGPSINLSRATPF